MVKSYLMERRAVRKRKGALRVAKKKGSKMRHGPAKLLKTHLEKKSTFCLSTMLMKINELHHFLHDVDENKGDVRLLRNRKKLDGGGGRSARRAMAVLAMDPARAGRPCHVFPHGKSAARHSGCQRPGRQSKVSVSPDTWVPETPAGGTDGALEYHYHRTARALEPANYPAHNQIDPIRRT
jgi:hypothetical protein